ncbi:hypothetical protein M2175_003136 [Bradyrhizobium elkanii]|uniref:hypothetical protein n=1 Tax=Bradyrhizobium TaxID=374 RepID=UPI00216A576D|nr:MULTISPECIES: hypothetical protein [Bradyrhizobium]MCS3928105.1 hypothetical protein [Bradyrhizobium elkanii]MCS3968659.1 hypothetical protein [Bradyrhizobium japonicum]
MSTDRQKPRQPRIDPDPPAQGIAELTGWPRWMADALAYRPQSPALEVGSQGETAALESSERRNVRILSRVSKA